MVQRHGKAIEAGYAELCRQLAAYKPDALVVLVTDSGRVFSQVQVPQFASFMGEEIWGSTRYSGLGEKAEDDIVQLKCAPELAQFVEQQLIEHEFDMNHLHTFRPLGAPEYGAPASLVAGVRALTPKLDRAGGADFRERARAPRAQRPPVLRLWPGTGRSPTRAA